MKREPVRVGSAAAVSTARAVACAAFDATRDRVESSSDSVGFTVIPVSRHDRQDAFGEFDIAGTSVVFAGARDAGTSVRFQRAVVKRRSVVLTHSKANGVVDRCALVAFVPASAEVIHLVYRLSSVGSFPAGRIEELKPAALLQEV